MIDTIFSPAFGNKPGTLVGRDQEMKILTDGLLVPSGNKERARLLIGQRGLGKTVLLLELAEYARKHDYIVASPTIVSSDMLDRILEKLERDGKKYITHSKPKVSGGSVGFFGFSAGIQVKNSDVPKRSFAYQLLDLCNAAEAHNKGILILVDEIQANSEELQKLLIAYQEMVGEGKNIAIVLAGLPAAIARTLNQHVLTFLNRAARLNLNPISTTEISIYYRSCFKKLAINLKESQLLQAAEATGGSPYMMQLIGHYITISAEATGVLPAEEYDRALMIARKEFITDICETTIAPLSGKDVAFLQAMSKDTEESAIQDICTRLNVDSSYVQRYKTRLSQAGIITQKRRGFVEFAVPYLKEYLQEDGSSV